MRKLKRHQSFRGVIASDTSVFGCGARGNFAFVRPLAFHCVLPLWLVYSSLFAPTAAIAANGPSGHSAEIAQPPLANRSTIRVDNNVYTPQNAGKSWSLSSPDADTLRFELRRGDHWSSPSWTDPDSSERDEIAGRTVYPAGTQINITYDFMVEPGETNCASGPGRWLVLGQMHEYNLSDSPPLAVELVDGDHMAINVGTKNPVYLYTDQRPIQRGHYYSMNIRVKFANHGDGFLEIWRDGASIVDYHGSLGTGVGTYWKEGIYRSSANESIAVRFRHLKITTVAMVTGISASFAKGAHSGAKSITVTLRLSGAVTVSGTPRLTFSDGSTAVYRNGSGTNVLIFSFVARPGETNVSIPEIAGVDLPNGATVRDALGTAADLSITRLRLQFDNHGSDDERRHINP